MADVVLLVRVAVREVDELCEVVRDVDEVLEVVAEVDEVDEVRDAVVLVELCEVVELVGVSEVVVVGCESQKIRKWERRSSRPDLLTVAISVLVTEVDELSVVVVRLPSTKAAVEVVRVLDFDVEDFVLLVDVLVVVRLVDLVFVAVFVFVGVLV